MPRTLPGSCLVVARPGARARQRRGVHEEDPRVHDRPDVPHRARRPPAGIGHRAEPGEGRTVTSPARPTGSPTRRTSTVLPRTREGLAARQGVLDGHDRGGPRADPGGDLRRGEPQEPRAAEGDHGAARRPAQDDGRRGGVADRRGQGVLLGDRGHALAGDRLARDADGAGLPAGGGGDAVHPGDPPQRGGDVHAGPRGRRPRAHGGRLPLPQGQPRPHAAVAPLLGQVRGPRQQPRRHGPGPASRAST